MLNQTCNDIQVNTYQVPFCGKSITGGLPGYSVAGLNVDAALATILHCALSRNYWFIIFHRRAFGCWTLPVLHQLVATMVYEHY